MRAILLIMISLMLGIYFSVYSQFPRNQQVVDGEYFIDPGPGYWQHIPGNYGFWEVTVQVPNLNVPVGSVIYVRFKSSNGTWSAPRGIKVTDPLLISGATLNYCEYYVNDDPGPGNGIQVTIQAGQYALIKDLSIKRGDKIYVRMKDSYNRWSPSKAVTFNFKDITKAEYKIKLGSTGNFTNPAPMNLSSVNDSSSIFIANQTNVPWQPIDTVFVQFQTADKFYSGWKREPLIIVGIEDEPDNGIPKIYALYQNYPNPFNPATTISYDLPKLSLVKIKVYDILGREVATLVNQKQLPGRYKITWDGSNYASGVYFYRISTEGFVAVKKALLIK